VLEGLLGGADFAEFTFHALGEWTSPELEEEKL
jgi:hypothetical protein